MFLILTFLATLFFLVGTFSLTAITSCLRHIPKKELSKLLHQVGHLFFYRPFHLRFFKENEPEGLFFATVTAQSISRLGLAASAILFLQQTSLYQNFHNRDATAWFWIVLIVALFIFLAFLIGDFLPRFLGMRFPEAILRFCTPVASIFMFLSLPVAYFFLKTSLSHALVQDNSHEPSAEIKQEFIDIIQKSEIGEEITPHDKKLLESVIRFKERIAREVMVPRVDLFTLPEETPIREAAKELFKEGYSRVPIYKDTVDEITGVLMYKDLLAKYQEYEEKGNLAAILEAPVSTIAKAALFTPETKKLSGLLQEIRKKQIHMAIVVDEYGGTEGIVTIEDILEEIVGDIADEYDLQEKFFWPQTDGSWIVDARMTLFDVREQFGIEIPEDGDYDTIAGYIFYRTGTIPPKKFVIHQDDFELEIVDSNERAVERVRLRATPLSEEEDTP